MSAQIQGWKDEYTENVEKFSLLIVVLMEVIKGTDKKAQEAARTKLSNAEEVLSRLKDVKKSFGLELRLVKDRSVKSTFEADAKVLESRVQELVKELRRCKVQMDKNSLMGGANQGTSASEVMMTNTAGKGNDELLQGASSIQDLTFDSIARSEAMIEEARGVGTASLEQLKEQRRQIQDIDDEINSMDSNLLRAQKLITAFSRRMYTDRIIQFFFGVNILILVCLILYVVVTGQSLAGDSST